MEWFFMIFGFLLASYSIVANDAIQTLGTFLASNRNRPWWQLWAYAGAILTAVLVYGWWAHNGDVSYGRLEKFPMPENFTWLYVVPPLVLLGMTRLGMPVSTTFLVLTVFHAKNLQKMLTKSVSGYLVAFLVALVLYFLVLKVFEKRFHGSRGQDNTKTWVALQWLSTGFLWSQWLIQDLANIYVYLPRQIPFYMLILSLGVMLALLAYIFYSSGGAIQKIVTSKTNTTDIRSATIIDLLLALVLFFFKELSNIPMSTTWVFLGLLAGREIILNNYMNIRPPKQTAMMVVSDGLKALAGLGVSVVIALSLPVIAGQEKISDKPLTDQPTAIEAPAELPAQDQAKPEVVSQKEEEEEPAH